MIWTRGTMLISFLQPQTLGDVLAKAEKNPQSHDWKSPGSTPFDAVFEQAEEGDPTTDDLSPKHRETDSAKTTDGDSTGSPDPDETPDENELEPSTPMSTERPGHDVSNVFAAPLGASMASETRSEESENRSDSFGAAHSGSPDPKDQAVMDPAISDDQTRLGNESLALGPKRGMEADPSGGVLTLSKAGQAVQVGRSSVPGGLRGGGERLFTFGTEPGPMQLTARSGIEDLSASGIAIGSELDARAVEPEGASQLVARGMTGIAQPDATKSGPGFTRHMGHVLPRSLSGEMTPTTEMRPPTGQRTQPNAPGVTLVSPADSANYVVPTPDLAAGDFLPLDKGFGDFGGGVPAGGSASAPTALADFGSLRPDTLRSAAAQTVEVFLRHPGKSVEIALNPEELGRVRMSLLTSETGISVSITSDRPETLDLLRRHIDQLAQEFQNLGYENAAFHFGGDPDSDPPTDSGGEISQTDTPDENDIANNLYTRLVPAGLDLRL